MKPNSTIKLGQTVKDLTTGIQGVAVSMSMELNGNLRFALQPPSAGDNKLVDALFSDEALLVVIDDGLAASAKPLRDIDIEPGQKVRDLASGAIGIVNMVTWHFNGCVYLTCVSEILKDGVPAAFVMPIERAKIVIHHMTGEPVSIERRVSDPPPGGPTTRAPDLR